MNVNTKRELVVCLEEGPKNQGKNHRTFMPDGKRREWKNKILTPQAIMGGVHGLDLPCVLYKAPVKRVNKYSKEIYALELSGVNHLGEFYLSKHLFNISFLCDPYLKTLPSRVASRSTIEVFYQLGNYHHLQDGINHSGLFLHCMLVTCDRGTQEFHGWNHLQTVIEPLVADVEISLPDVDYEEAKKGYFYPLLPPAGQRKPYADAKFVDSIYYQLESSGFLEKKQEDDGGHKYRVTAGGPPVEKIPEFTDDWLFEYGRNVRTSQHREEDLRSNLFTRRGLKQNSIFFQLSLSTRQCCPLTRMDLFIYLMFCYQSLIVLDWARIGLFTLKVLIQNLKFSIRTLRVK